MDLLPTDLADATMADCAAAMLTVRAGKELLADIDAAVRDRVMELANLSGGGRRWDLDGIGRLVRTAPKPRPTVTDRAAWTHWYADRYPDQVATRTVVNGDLVDAVTAAVQTADDDTLAAVCRLLDVDVTPLRETVTLLPEKALDRVTALADGVCVSEDGEPVPGLSSTRKDPTIQFTPDPAGLAGWRDQVAAALARPALEAADPDAVHVHPSTHGGTR